MGADAPSMALRGGYADGRKPVQNLFTAYLKQDGHIRPYKPYTQQNVDQGKAGRGAAGNIYRHI